MHEIIDVSAAIDDLLTSPPSLLRLRRRINNNTMTVICAIALSDCVLVLSLEAVRLNSGDGYAITLQSSECIEVAGIPETIILEEESNKMLVLSRTATSQKVLLIKYSGD